MVTRIADARAEQLRLLEMLAVEGKLHVTIDGIPMDEAIVFLVRPVIAGELRGRVRSLEHDLTSMGVQVDREASPATSNRA